MRLHYVYPYPHVDEVIPLMAEGKLLPYLDMPFQHASPRILKLMKRPAGAKTNAGPHSRLARGLPGPDHAQHLHRRVSRARPKPNSTSCSTFLEEAQLDRVGCFAYSPVEGADGERAARPGAQKRLSRSAGRRFMEKQAQISARRLRLKIGREMTVLVDSIDDEGNAVARSAADAPEIDGSVLIPRGRRLPVGEFVQVKIADAGEHDLWAEPA